MERIGSGYKEVLDRPKHWDKFNRMKCNDDKSQDIYLGENGQLPEYQYML